MCYSDSAAVQLRKEILSQNSAVWKSITRHKPRDWRDRKGKKKEKIVYKLVYDGKRGRGGRKLWIRNYNNDPKAYEVHQ